MSGPVFLSCWQAAIQEADGGSCMMLAGGGQDARDVALVGAARQSGELLPNGLGCKPRVRLPLLWGVIGGLGN